MSASLTLETFVSLTLQVTLLVGAVAWALRGVGSHAVRDASWARLHVLILALSAAAFFFPHVRLFKWADFVDSGMQPVDSMVCAAAGRICGLVWGGGALAMFTLCGWGMVRTAALVRHARSDEILAARLARVMAAMACGGRPIEIRVSQACVSPFCWQFHRPVIVMPAFLLAFSDPELAAIVRHESGHLRWKHPIRLFLQRLVESIYWYHPLIWWLSRQTAADREFRCDSAAVRNREELADYLRSLLRLVELRQGSSYWPSADLRFLREKSLLKRRVEALESPVSRQSCRGAWLPRMALVSGLAVCTLLWIPVNPLASRRELLSPWPSWSARSLDASGIHVRDYESDGHRLRPHERWRS